MLRRRLALALMFSIGIACEIAPVRAECATLVAR